MEENQIAIYFCKRCSKKIRSPSLYRLWVSISVHTVCTKKPISLLESYEPFIKILEKKHFVVSTDDDKRIYVLSQGVRYDEEEGEYWICTCRP